MRRYLPRTMCDRNTRTCTGASVSTRLPTRALSQIPWIKQLQLPLHEFIDVMTETLLDSRVDDFEDLPPC